MSQAALCLLAAGTVVSCVDDEYDLSKDIDMTVTVGGSNLVVPASSTEPITLKKLFDLDDNEDQALKVAKAGNLWGLDEGDYFLNENSGEDATESSIDVDRVTVDFDKMEADEADLNFPKIIAGEAESVDQIIDLSTKFDLDQNDVSGQLRELDWLELDAPVQLTLRFDPKSHSNVERLYVKKGFEIIFPEYVTLATSAQGWKAEGNKVVSTEDHLCTYANGTYLEVNIAKVDFYHPSYPVSDRLIPGATRDDKGEIHMKMSLRSTGWMSLRKDNFPANAEMVHVGVQVIAKMDEVEVLTVAGIVDPDFNVTINPVDFVDVPEFLDDPQTNIDLMDPRIFLTVTSESPIGMNIHGVLKPLDANGELMKDIHGQPVEVRISGDDDDPNALIVPNGTTTFELSPSGTATPGRNAKPIKVENLSKLIARVPAKIAVEEVKPTALQEQFVLKLNRKYDVNTEYEIIAPLAFGRDLNFVYRDTLDGWQEDLEDFELSHVEVELTAHNQVPMQMKLDALPLDAEGNVLTDVKVTVTGNIPAGNGQTIRENHLKIELDAVGGTIRNLDGLQLVVTGNSTDESVGKRLNEKQTLQFTGVKLRIKDGITLDLN